jgi:hypothetical protein
MIDPLVLFEKRVASLMAGPLREYAEDDVRAFLRFHTENPKVWEAFVTFAREALAAGAKRIGARLIAERVRWEARIERRGAYKLNDHYTPMYARMLVAKNPELGPVFEFRENRTRRAA